MEIIPHSVSIIDSVIMVLCYLFLSISNSFSLRVFIYLNSIVTLSIAKYTSIPIINIVKINSAIIVIVV